jgi:hypothetical protein
MSNVSNPIDNSTIAESLFELNGSGSTIIQLDFNNVPGPALNSQFFGVGNSFNSYIYAINPTQYPTSSNFISGSGNVINSNDWIARASFCQGEGNSINYAYGSFIQGLNNMVLGGQGSPIFCVGLNNTIQSGQHHSSHCTGSNNTMETKCSSTLCHGISNQIRSEKSLCIGNIHSVFGPGGNTQGSNCIIVGQQSIIWGNNSVCVGANNSCKGDDSLTFGSSAFVQGNGSFVQGNNSHAISDRTFVQGRSARATREDQKSWGSNSNFSQGYAQKSRMVKFLSTLNNTESTLVFLDLEQDKTYAIRLLVSARNTTTNAESAAFELNSALAYRDASGAAVLINNPIAISGINSGGGSVDWSASLMNSGNNVLLRVIGDTSDTIRWLADFEFVEVHGNAV